MASRGNATGESNGSLAESEPPASEATSSVLGMMPVSDDPLPAIGLQIGISGTAPEVTRLQDSMLSREPLCGEGVAGGRALEPRGSVAPSP